MRSPTLTGLHPLYEVHRRQVLNECWPPPALVVEGINVEDIFELVSLVWPPPAIVVEGIHAEDIFELVSLVLSFIISWIFRILAHEEEQYTDFLSIALKQTKAGPRSS